MNNKVKFWLGLAVIIIINEIIIFRIGITGLASIVEALLVGILYGLVSKFEFGWDIFGDE